MAESVPNKDQTQKDKPKDTKNQEKPNRSVIDVKPVTMDKPQSSRQAKSSIELELEKAIREKEELIATIMNLENSEDKTSKLY